MSSYYGPPQGPPNAGAADSYYNTGYAAPQQSQYGQQPQYTQQPQPQYAQQQQQGNYPPQNMPPQNMPQTGYSAPQGSSGASFDEKFTVTKPKWNDLWAAILFLITVAGFVVVSGLSLHGYSATRGVNGGGIYDDRSNTFSLSTNTIVLFIFDLLVAAVVSYLYFQGARMFTKQFIYATAIINIVLGIGTAIYYFIKHYYSAAIIFLIFALFYAFCFWTWRSRIPFSVLMLQTAIDVAKHHGHVFTLSFIGGLVAVAMSAWFAVTFVAVYVKYTPSANNPACGLDGGGCSNAKVIGLLVFITFAMYWISEVIKNVMHVTVAGVYGSWYFCVASGMPRHPTLGAFKRAMTYSFGSISFGSLIVSLIQLLRQACSLAQQQNAMEGNIIACAIFCCLRCILDLVNWLVQFFNEYAFSYIALYGKAYIPAAKDTWKLMKDRGMDALIQQCIISPVLTSGAVFVGYLCALLAYLYLQFTSPLYNQSGSYTPVVMAFSFLIGLQIANVVLNPIKSGISTIFTSMAWDPAIMAKDHPQLYREMIRVYPDVQNRVFA